MDDLSNFFFLSPFLYQDQQLPWFVADLLSPLELEIAWIILDGDQDGRVSISDLNTLLVTEHYTRVGQTAIMKAPGIPNYFYIYIYFKLTIVCILWFDFCLSFSFLKKKFVYRNLYRRTSAFFYRFCESFFYRCNCRR